MGALKRAMLEDDDGYCRFLRELLDEGGIEGPGAGITKKVISDGGDTEQLTEKQMHVFQTHVIDPYVTPECTSCGCSIPWSEMQAARDNGGLCSWCWNRESKND
jgi:hypothetical protein